MISEIVINVFHKRERWLNVLTELLNQSLHFKKAYLFMYLFERQDDREVEIELDSVSPGFLP